MNMESYVQLKLLNCPEITDGLAKADNGRPLISLIQNPHGRFPQIVVKTANNYYSQFADDEILAEISVIEIVYYCEKGEFQNIQATLDSLMFTSGLTKSNYYSLQDPYTNIEEYHSVYRSNFQPQTLDKWASEEQLKRDTPEVKLQRELPEGKYLNNEGKPIEIK